MLDKNKRMTPVLKKKLGIMVPKNSVEQETDNSPKIDMKFVCTVWRYD